MNTRYDTLPTYEPMRTRRVRKMRRPTQPRKRVVR